VGRDKLNRLWLRGGFPDAYLARTNQDCFQWLESFTRTFLERDLAQLGIRTPGSTLRRFWTMLAHWHGQIWNSSQFARSFGVADTTIRHYLDVLTDTLVVHQLQPWHENIKKRQVKAPKIYLRDSGLVHSLLRINDMRTLESHPKLGASWEGLMINLIMEKLRPKRPDYYFWATHTGAELDLFILHGQKRLGIEIKRTTSPEITSSMRTAQHDLNLGELVVVHAGDTSYPLGENVRAVSANKILEEL
jgi:predicted AAA+ superfamily ATPase